MVEKQTVEGVVGGGLCMGCGTCVAACPEGAVQIVETPGGFLAAAVDAAACTSCGLCADACPGRRLASGLLPEDVNPFKGRVAAAFIAQATDRDLLTGAQSGGAVTALLCRLLESGQIDDAVVTHMPEDGSLRAQAIRARTRDGLLGARGSKYCHVAVTAALRERGEGRTAFVGLPCHVHGLRNMEALCPERVGSTAFVVGLICAGVFSTHMIDHLIGRAGAKPEDVAGFDYRSKAKGGWPGDVRVHLRDGEERWVPHRQRIRCKGLFEPVACRLCFDQMNILSDVTVGDPWGLVHDEAGRSVVIARTERGLAALLDAQRAGVLALQPVTAEEVFEGQTVDVRHRRDWSAFTAAWRRMGHDAPDFGIADAWRTDTGGIDLAPYERRLSDAAALGNTPTLRQARAMVKRRVRRLRLRTALSPAHLAARVGRFLWRCLMRVPRGKRTRAVEHIAFFGAHFARNLGGASVICGASNALSREFPDARFTLMGPDADVTTEESLAARFGMTVVPAGRLARHKSLLVSALLWRLTRLRVGTAKALRVMRLLLDADVVVDVAGILFADSLGSNTARYRLGEGGHALAARLLGKPVIKYTSAFGPCRTKWNRRFARFCLQECYDLLLARDERSLQEVRRIGVTTESIVCPDSGFLFEDAPSDDSVRLAGIRETRPIVGVSLSYRAQLHASEPEAYLAAMEQLALHCIGKHGAHVVLIPNEIHADRRDDMDIARMVHDSVTSPHCEVLLAGRMAPDELKGVVHECDVVVAARYHTAVAALSLGVPVLAVAWHHKYREVLRPFGQEGHVCHVRCCTPAGITGMFDALWRARSTARQDILAALPAVKEQVRQGARRAAEACRRH